MAEATNKKPNFFVRTGRRIAKWFREMKSELKKVVWPTGKQLLNNTLIVLGAVIVFGVLLFAFDWLAMKGVSLLGGLF
ncbi:MAG: preprotein translocase subunit SecE [Ruminococcaceae bacterium]|nr:preprotein translocase subunit SecE [Oscillospiraceae bacterium]